MKSRSVDLNELKIYEIIANADSKGLSRSQIASLSQLHETTVSKHCTRLIKKGVVSKKGLFGNFHVTTKASKDYAIEGQEFFAIARRLLNDPFSIQNPNIRLPPLDPIALGVFDFSNRMGVLITFILMECFRPSKSLLAKHRRIKRELAHRWVNAAIKPELLLLQFFGFMSRIGLTPKDFELSHNKFNLLLRGFEKAYPPAFQELDQIRKDLPSLVQYYEKWVKQLAAEPAINRAS
jgi:hypothetical protein